MLIVKLKRGMDQSFIMQYSGQGKDRVGGITLLWKENLKLKITSFSINHINGSLVDE